MKRSEAAKRWRARLEAFERSDLKATDFCQREGISTTTFYKWRRRLRGERDEAKRVELSFVEVAPGGDGGAIELQLSSGVVLRLAPEFDEATLQRVVGLLHESR